MGKVSGNQVIVMGAVLVFSVGLKHPPVVMMEVAKEGAWIGYIAAFLLMVPPLWLLHRVSKRYPDLDLFQSLTKEFPVLGKGVVALYLLYFLFVVAHDIRFIMSVVNILLLPTTPLVVIGMVVVIAAYLSARGGVEVIARLCEVFFPVLAIVILSLPLFLTTQSDVRNLLPLEWDLFGLTRSVFYAFGGIAEVIVLPFIAAYPFYRLRNSFIGLAFGTFLLLLLLLYTLLVFGPHVASMFFDPPYVLVRQIRVTDFLDRLDLPIVAVWLPIVFVKISLYIYVISYGIKTLMPQVSSKLIRGPVSLWGLVCANGFFEGSAQLINLAKFRPILMAVVAFLLPLGMFIWLKPKNSKPLVVDPESQ